MASFNRGKFHTTGFYINKVMKEDVELFNDPCILWNIYSKQNYNLGYPIKCFGSYLSLEVYQLKLYLMILHEMSLHPFQYLKYHARPLTVSIFVAMHLNVFPKGGIDI